MLVKSGAAALVCSGLLCGQALSSRYVERLRELFAAGKIPPYVLQTAEADGQADARDTAFLALTLYGQEPGVDLADNMVAATKTRLERRQRTVDEAQRLFSAGLLTRDDLRPLYDDMDAAIREISLASSRAGLVHQMAQLATLRKRLGRIPMGSYSVAEHYEGKGTLNFRELQTLELDYATQFSRGLPFSSVGATALHRALGFDHRGRYDVAVSPDQPEGIWLRNYLAAHRIPYYAFRCAVPGRATGAHIHIGPGSAKLVQAASSD